MNFTEKVKKEITVNGIEKECCARACLSAYMRLNGSLCRGRNGIGFEFSTDNEEVVNFIVDLFNTYYNTEINELDINDDVLNGKDRFTGTYLKRNALQILAKLKNIENTQDALILLSNIDSEIIKEDCCKIAYIKGAFLGGGNLTVPSEIESGSKTGYHLEIVFNSHDLAVEFSQILAYFNMFFKIIERKENYSVYIKNSEDIKDFLALLGLNKSVLELTDIICRKEFSSNINRQRNCDLGNLGKQVDAVEKQLRAIELIKDTIGLENIDKSLVEVINARVENTEDTMQELANKLGITKSCLNHRLRKIVALADSLK